MSDPNRYQVYAINLYDTINIKTIRSLLSGKVLDTSPQEIRLQYGENSFLFVYRFGCLVFFNMSQDQIEAEINKFKTALGGGIAAPTTETYQVVSGANNNVEFEYVELKKPSVDYLRLIAITVGQSAALEYFELSADRMLYETSQVLGRLGSKGRIPFNHKAQVKIIGSTTGARQHIIANLAILDPPDETWKSKELEKLYKELQQNFDIEVRFRTLDRKLALVQDNISLLTNLITHRRSSMLEVLIAVLIIMELVLAFLKH